MRNFLLALSGLLITMTASAQQVAKGLTAKNGKFVGFYEYTPTDYAANPNTKYPLIIFLHGGGEKGNGTTELSRVASVGGTPPRLIQDGNPMRFTWNGKTETFIVLSPQCSSEYGWWQNWYVDEMLDYAMNNLRIDPNRIFLTGLSMGGNGTWDYSGASLTNAQKFAAVAVSCGGCQTLDWCNFAKANLPVWAFHAIDDGAIPYMCTVTRIDNINACNPAVKPYMTIWPDGNHYIWGRVYDPGYQWQNPNLYEWFLGQNKSLPVNQRPVANPGANQSITTGTGSVTLNAGSSTDADGRIVRYVWSKTSGPNAGNITTPVSQNGVTTVTGLTVAGTYQYQVKVIDDRADWTTATVTITVTTGTPEKPTNQAPVANAGADITITSPANSVTLDGKASYDPDGSIAAYSWSYVSGPSQYTIASPNAVSTTVSNLVTGTYVFKLKVTDNAGATAEANVTVIVKGANDKPLEVVVNAGPDIDLTLPANSTTLDGSTSSDPKGPFKAYEWKKIAGPDQFTLGDARAAKTAVSNLVKGDYSFQFTAWDNAWYPRSDTMIVRVKDGNGTSTPTPTDLPPVPNAGPDITITLPTNTATLNGSASSDPNPGGVIKAWKWRWISGPSQYTIANASVATTTVSNLTEGVYNFELMVWGNNYMPRTDTVQLTVKAAAAIVTDLPPVPNAGPDITITLPTNSTTLNGTASSDPNTGGVLKAWKWRWISGPSQYTIANASAPTTALTNLVAGTYSFELMVWGNNWMPRADTVNVTVKNGPTSGPLPSIANAGPDIMITLPVNTATLDGSASVDPKGPIKAYEWTKISGSWQGAITSPKSAVTTVTGLVQGIYSFRLTVWDNDWKPYSDTVLVAVSSGDIAPRGIANAGPDIAITLPANSCVLNGSASYDPAGPIKAYKWRCFSGPSQYNIANPSAAITNLTGLAEGIYGFELMVWGNNWYPIADTVLVVVSAVNSSSALKTTALMMNQSLAKVASTNVAEKLDLYPNPARDMINLQASSTQTGTSYIQVYDATGRLLKKTGFQKSQPIQLQTLSIGDLKPGVYQVEVVIDTKTRLTSRFIKQ